MTLKAEVVHIRNGFVWLKRYLRLTDHTITIHKNESTLASMQSISISDVESVRQSQAKKACCFEIKARNIGFVVACDSEDSMLEWIFAIIARGQQISSNICSESDPHSSDATVSSRLSNASSNDTLVFDSMESKHKPESAPAAMIDRPANLDPAPNFGAKPHLFQRPRAASQEYQAGYFNDLFKVFDDAVAVPALEFGEIKSVVDIVPTKKKPLLERIQTSSLGIDLKMSKSVGCVVPVGFAIRDPELAPSLRSGESINSNPLCVGQENSVIEPGVDQQQDTFEAQLAPVTEPVYSLDCSTPTVPEDTEAPRLPSEIVFHFRCPITRTPSTDSLFRTLERDLKLKPAHPMVEQELQSKVQSPPRVVIPYAREITSPPCHPFLFSPQMRMSTPSSPLKGILKASPTTGTRLGQTFEVSSLQSPVPAIKKRVVFAMGGSCDATSSDIPQGGAAIARFEGSSTASALVLNIIANSVNSSSAAKEETIVAQTAGVSSQLRSETSPSVVALEEASTSAEDEVWNTPLESITTDPVPIALALESQEALPTSSSIANASNSNQIILHSFFTVAVECDGDGKNAPAAFAVYFMVFFFSLMLHVLY
ncbi:hypothetical protein HDU98_000204 [Podochytrium sp. JEL0797]|nr:hypothetical protein HDU98_000204 [Podochytrium sp. JEL0797]